MYYLSLREICGDKGSTVYVHCEAKRFFCVKSAQSFALATVGQLSRGSEFMGCGLQTSCCALYGRNLGRIVHRGVVQMNLGSRM